MEPWWRWCWSLASLCASSLTASTLQTLGSERASNNTHMWTNRENLERKDANLMFFGSLWGLSGNHIAFLVKLSKHVLSKCKSKDRYDYIRVALLPLRIAVSTGIVLQTSNLTHWISVVARTSVSTKVQLQWWIPALIGLGHLGHAAKTKKVFSVLSIAVLVIDFIFGDLFLNLGQT